MKKGLLLFIILPNILWAQDSVEWKTNFINALSIYRNYLIQNDIENTENLKNTIKKWEEFEQNPETLKAIIYQSKFAYALKDVSYNFIIKKANSEYPHSHLPNQITEEDLQIFSQNSDLVDLISFEVLDYKYPFRIIPNHRLFEEIEFYDIQQNEIIAEIGAGNGTFSQMLSMLGKEITLIINEIDKDVLKYIAIKKENKAYRIDSNHILIVKGSKKEINLPHPVDKIIIRNSFHHFSKKQQMLESIIGSLNPNGRLFIFETLKNETNPSACKYKMEDYEIKSIFENTGFLLQNEKKIGNTILLEYVLLK